jgi:hypothetical protein
MSDERATIANAGELNNIEITKQSTKPADDISAIASVPYLNSMAGSHGRIRIRAGACVRH